MTTATIKRLPTYELFDVQEREGQKAFWNKVGAAFELIDLGGGMLLVAGQADALVAKFSP